MESPRWIALGAATPADARDYMIEGPGGILRNAPPDQRPHYEPSKRRITWPNGSWATIYSGEEPDQARGFSGDTAWLDEFAKYAHPREFWENLQFGMREVSADQPRVLITTTPRPLQILTEIEKSPDTVVVTGSSYENRANLDPRWYARTIKPYEGTRLGRQEIKGEILTDMPGALWTLDMIDKLRVVTEGMPDLVRTVVAIDPSGTKGSGRTKAKGKERIKETANDVGIIVASKGVDGHAYVRADLTCNLSPAGWGRRAVRDGYERFQADRVVAEVNFGGAMVESVITSIDADVPFTALTASRGKHVRAEPIAALYERGLVHHTDGFGPLEDQMTQMLTDGYSGEGSPDRLDALVWALTELMLGDALEYDESMGWVR
jgi:phage terminase large subunit-like protein